MQMTPALVIVILQLLLPGAPRASRWAQVNVEYEQHLLFVPVTVNGEVGIFLLDTGANTSAIDSSLAGRLRLRRLNSATIEGSTGTADADNTVIDRLMIGTIKVENLKVTMLDLARSLAPAGEKLAGILGYDVLNRFSVTIDYRLKRAIFSSEGMECASGPTIYIKEDLPFRLDNGIPRVPIVLQQNVLTEMRVDTGASLFETRDVYINVTEPDWAALQSRYPALTPTRYLSASGTGAQVRVPVVQLETLRIGEAVIPHPFIIIQPQVGYFARSEAVGFISNNLLERFSPVVIDGLHRRLCLSSPTE